MTYNEYRLVMLIMCAVISFGLLILIWTNESKSELHALLVALVAIMICAVVFTVGYPGNLQNWCAPLLRGVLWVG